MTFGTPIDLGPLLNALVTKIGTTDEILPPERVLLTLENDADLDLDPLSDAFLTIAPVDFPIDDGAVDGGGNDLMATNSTIEVALYNRFEVDYTHLDVQALTDATNGILTLWKSILTSLQLFTPDDGHGAGYLLEPMRCRGWKVPKRKTDSPWLRIVSQWEMKFVQDLS